MLLDDRSLALSRGKRAGAADRHRIPISLPAAEVCPDQSQHRNVVVDSLADARRKPDAAVVTEALGDDNVLRVPQRIVVVDAPPRTERALLRRMVESVVRFRRTVLIGVVR